MITCSLCGSLVAEADTHAGWHMLYEMHHPECEAARTKAAQKRTGMYLTPGHCTCGLNDLIRKDTEARQKAATVRFLKKAPNDVTPSSQDHP